MQERILISAYAFSPTAGSEPGVGWNWARVLAERGEDVTVITRASHASPAQAYLRTERPDLRITVVSVGSRLLEAVAQRSPPLLYAYYYVWSGLAFLAARTEHARAPFGIVHTLTYGGVRMPSFIGHLAPRSILGPLGGGDYVPKSLFGLLSRKVRFAENIRRLANRLNSINPATRFTFASAKEIYVRTDATGWCIPARYRSKVRQCHEIGVPATPSPPPSRSHETPRFIFAGRFLAIKGVEILIRAYAIFIAAGGDGELWLAGDGPAGTAWRSLAKELGVLERIQWLGWVPANAVTELYRQADVFVFPSLRDSGGTVVLEALSNGLPVICLDLGGPGALINDSIGRKINADGASILTVTEEFSNAMLELAGDRALRDRLALAAVDYVSEHTWEARVASVYDGELHTS